MRWCHASRAVVLAVLLAGGGALTPPHAGAQTPTFTVEGVITDEQQAVLPGATVTIHNVATNLSRTATTDAEGRYVFSALPPEGRYEITVELTGFSTQLRNNLTFNAGQRAVINVPMKLSNIQETITVAGESPLVQITSSEVSSTIDRQAFETLPVHQRNYMRLLSLDSNVVQSRPGTNAVNVGGGEVWNFGTYVDGTNNHSKWLTLQRAPQQGSGGFALETVKEVQLITNAFSVEFGGHSAGVASMITKSGTNSVAGSIFGMLRPGDLDARPPLARVDVPYNQQQVGGVIGGALVQDKMFYFASYEYRRERSEVAISSVASPVPSVETPADEHQGHLRHGLPLQRRQLAGRALQHGALAEGHRDRRAEPARHRLHLGQQRRHRARHVHDGGVVALPQRGARAVLALHRQPRRQARRGEHQPHQLLDQRRQRPGDLGRAARDDLRSVEHGLDVDGQAHHEGRRVDHLRRHRAAVPAAAERRLPLRRQPARSPRIRSNSTSRSRWCRKRG